jgi:2-methylcitrate dehydratase PrpD
MLVNELGRFTADTTYDSLNGELIDAIKARILDILGSGLAAVRLGTHDRLLQLFRGNSDTTAAVWGTNSSLPIREAALVNSFLGHSTYLDDGSRYSGSHPGAVVVPAPLALAESRRLSGKALIASVAAGYEVLLRVGQAIYPSTVTRGFQATAVLGSIGSAAATANLLRLDATASKNALAIACNLGVGLKEALKSSQSQPLQVARSCEGGMLAAFYAELGAEGADSIIESGFLKAFADNADASKILVDLGKRSRIFETYIKVHGGCRGNHSPIDVVRSLAYEYRFAPGDIASIEVYVDTVTYAGEIHDPQNGDQAQFSVPFSIAVAMLNGDASIFQYTDAQIRSAPVREMMKRIKVIVDKTLDEGYPDRRGSRAVVTLADGRHYQGILENAKGEPECPLTQQEIEGKFFALGREVLGDNADRARDIVMALEKVEDISVLAQALRPHA